MNMTEMTYRIDCGFEARYEAGADYRGEDYYVKSSEWIS